MLGIEPPNTTAALPLSWAPADLIGQGTWRINQDRARWAIWSNPVVSEDVWLLTLAPIKKEKTLTENAMLIFKPFTLEVQVQNNSAMTPFKSRRALPPTHRFCSAAPRGFHCADRY